MALPRQPSPSAPKTPRWPVWALLGGGVVGVLALLLVVAMPREESAPGSARPEPMPQASPSPSGRAAGVPAPVATQPLTAQDVRPAENVAQPFPQLHTKPRRARKEGERAAARPKQELFKSDDGALFDTADPVEVPFEGDFPDRGTFSFWLNPVWDPTSQDDASFVTVADGRLRIVKNVSFLRYETVDASGNADGVGFRITDWQPGEWHFVTATWDTGVIALYVDGVQVAQKYIPALELPADSSVTVGSLFPPGRPVAPGMIGGFRFRGRPLTSGTIGREFETTMPAPVGEDVP